jgi:DNA-binding beta-propeller fold protein YncE
MSLIRGRSVRILLLAGAALLVGAVAAQTHYHVAKTYTLGGDGGWDYLALDTVNHHLFIARENHFMVVDPSTGKLVGEIPGMNRAHGVAFAYDVGHGFATSGGDSTVTMFDLKTLRVLGTTIAAVDDDDVIYDPATRRVYTFNGDAHSASVIDPASGKNFGTIDLGAKPESGVSTDDGKLYVNLSEAGEVAEVDARAMKVIRTWSVAPCTAPTGMAVDLAHHRLFSTCRSKVLAVSDLVAGRLDRYTVVQTVKTMEGARTMTLDYGTHTVYTASAKFGPVPQGATGRRRRPPVLPGTFTLLVMRP